MDHKCEHEGHIATILERTKNTDDTLDIICRDLKSMRETLNGNGKEGLVTRVALVKQSMGRVWWWLGGISMAILAVAVRTIWP